MGLEQEVKPSVGKQSIRLSTRPLSERLSWFDHRFRTPVQQTIQGFIASALILSGVHSTLLSVSAEPLPQSTGITRLVTPESSTITPLTLELSDRVTHEIVKPLINLGLDIDLTGELLTNAWIDDEGKGNIVYRNIWLQTGLQAGMEDKLKLVDTPDWLNQLGLDEQLAAGILGDPLPPRQDTDIEAGEETEAFLSALNSVLDIGPVVGYRNYGPFEVYRTPNIAIMRILEGGPQANTFQLTNTGYQALAAGLISKEHALSVSPLPFATGGGGGGEIQSPETGENIMQPEYLGKALKIYNPKDENGEVYQDFGIKVTNQERFDELDKTLKDNSIDLTFQLVRSAPDKEFNWSIAICGSRYDKQCDLRYINLRKKPNPDGKSMIVELGLGDAAKTTVLTSDKKEYLNNQNLLRNIGLLAGELKYNTEHVAYISNPTVKKEADAFVMQIADIGMGGLEFVLPSAPLG